MTTILEVIDPGSSERGSELFEAVWLAERGA
jgi:hypothetical protein